MKMYLKRGLTLIMLTMLFANLVGCSNIKKNKDEIKIKQDEELIYVAEFFTLGESYFLPNTWILIEDKLYYIFKDKQEMTLNSFDVNDKTKKTVPVNLNRNVELFGIVEGTNNTIWLIHGDFTSDAERDEIYMIQINLEGEQLQKVDISDLDGIESGIGFMISDFDGNIYLSDGFSNIWVLDQNGELLFSLPIQNTMKNMGLSKEGTVVAAIDEVMGTTLKTIDISKKAFGQTYIDAFKYDELKGYSRFLMTTGINNSFLIADYNNIFTYDLKEEKKEMLFKLIDHNINDIRNLFMLEDERIVAISYDKDMEIVIFSKVPVSEIEEKIIITFGTFGSDPVMQLDIVRFNKLNKKYRVEVKDYASADYEDSIVQLNADISAGKGPDVINLQQPGISFKDYAKKGIFEDLYPYIENDNNINMQDYYENILTGYDVDGKLYGIVSKFSVETLIGKSKDLGEKESWSIEEFMEFVNRYPDKSEIFEYGTKSGIVNMFISNNINQYINWDTGECNFNTKEFGQVLEYANRYPQTWTFDPNATSLLTKIRTGEQLICPADLSSMDEMQRIQLMFQEDTTFIGYPSNTYNGISAIPTIALAINAQSTNKDGAWEFLSFFLSEENQITDPDSNASLPVHKNSFTIMMENEMTPITYIDENGIEVEIENTVMEGDWEYVLPTATEEDVKQLKQLIERVSLVEIQEVDIIKIIVEESTAYFEGTKTISEVTEIIQNRMQIYVNERQ